MFDIKYFSGLLINLSVCSVIVKDNEDLVHLLKT